MRLTDLIDDACRRWGDRVAFRTPGSDDVWTYERVRAATDAIATALQEHGVERGVAILSHNTPLAFVVHLAALKAGLAQVPLNTKSRSSDWSSLLAASGATALVVGQEFADQTAQLRAEHPQLRVVPTTGVGGGDSVMAWIEEYAEATPSRVPDDPEAPCWIIGSGGTTGTPKAINMPNRALLTMTLALVSHMPDERPVQVVSAPLTHAAGGLTYPVLIQGGETIVLDGARPGEILRTIASYQATRIFLPPTAIYALLDSDELDQHDYSSLRYFLYGAAPMSATKLEEAMDVFGPVMTQFYGQAEAVMICTWFGPDEHAKARADGLLRHRLRSCGRPSAVAEVRVVDKSGQPLLPGETGEIAVRTDLRANGYLNAPEEWARLEAADGYRRTGDVGHIDADGFVYITDRARDMIISGGFNVFPSEVEAVIWEHPSVKECAVFGRADAYWGEAVVAAIELKDGTSECTEDILARCRELLGPVKTPKEIIYTHLPKSAVGKVLKRALRNELAQETEAAQAANG